MPSPSVSLQLGLFGQAPVIVGHHVVSAHTRVRSDGTEVFVGEHLRMDRGRGIPRMSTRQVPSTPDPDCDAQGDLFTPPPEQEDHRMVEVELLPGAWQLPLWRA